MSDFSAKATVAIDSIADPWARKAMRHWREFQPKRFKELLESGKLVSEACRASKLTQKEIQDLTDVGATWDEAWEVVRERHLFPPEESKTSPGRTAYEQLLGVESSTLRTIEER